MGEALKAFLAKFGDDIGPAILAKLKTPAGKMAGVGAASGAAGYGLGSMGGDDEEPMDDKAMLIEMLKRKGLL
jgi:hypothetical protein